MASEDEIRAKAEEIMKEMNESPLSDGVTSVHEMFLSLQTAGFTRLEALWLAGYILISGSMHLEE